VTMPTSTQSFPVQDNRPILLYKHWLRFQVAPLTLDVSGYPSITGHKYVRFIEGIQMYELFQHQPRLFQCRVTPEPFKLWDAIAIPTSSCSTHGSSGILTVALRNSPLIPCRSTLTAGGEQVNGNVSYPHLTGQQSHSTCFHQADFMSSF